MNNLLHTLLCFVFVGQCLSQLSSYGRQRTIRKRPVVIHPKPIFHPKPVVPKPFHPKPANPMLFGGSNSVFGQGPVAQSGMVGSQFGGDRIVHDIAKSASFGTVGFSHNIAKEGQFQHGMVKSSVGGGQINQGSHINRKADAQMAHNFDKSGGGTIGMSQLDMGQPIGAGGRQFEHDMVKSSVGGRQINQGSHINRKANAQMAHNFDKSGGGTIGIGSQFEIGQPIGVGGRQFQHGMVKSSDGGGQINQGSHINRKADAQKAHHFVKSGSGTIGMSQFDIGQPIGVGGRQFQHNMVKSSDGGGHIAAGKPKYDGGFIISNTHGGISAGAFGVGVPSGTSFINQGSHISRKADAQMSHNFDKSSGRIGTNSFGQNNQGHFSIGQPIGSSVVHDVNKVGAVGAASIGHDRLASQVGHGLAKSSIADSASIVDMRSGGAVSMGNPFANLAAARLAQESLHVAQKTVGMATNGGGQHIQPVMKKPTMPRKPFVVPNGYGRRTRTHH